jgi:hypothetical protein
MTAFILGELPWTRLGAAGRAAPAIARNQYDIVWRAGAWGSEAKPVHFGKTKVGEPFLLDYTGSALHVFTNINNSGSQAGLVFMCADDRAQSTGRRKNKEYK